MTEKEKKAIKVFECKAQALKEEIKERQNDEVKGYGTLEDLAKVEYCNIRIILNLIQKQQVEINELELLIEDKENYKDNRLICDLGNMSTELEKKDKIIDKLIQQIETMRENSEEDCFIPKEISSIDECVKTSCKDCIYQYFEKQVESEDKQC